MLKGARPTEVADAARMKMGLSWIILLPGALLGASLIAVGVFAYRDPEHFGGMELGIPAGIVLTILTALAIYAVMFIFPKRTLDSFEYEGDRFRGVTLLERKVDHDVSALETITRTRTGPGRPLRGWWLTFSENGRRDVLYLEVETVNAYPLIEQLSQRLAAKKA